MHPTKLLALAVAPLALAACENKTENTTTVTNDTVVNVVEPTAPAQADNAAMDAANGALPPPEAGMMDSANATDGEDDNEIDRGNPENRGAK